MKTILSFFLCLMFLGTATFAQSSPDTPFIKKYRPRYEANLENGALSIVLYYANKECKQKCLNNDKVAIAKLADAGDKFAIAILHVVVNENVLDIMKKGADAEEVISLLTYGSSLAASDYEMGKSYFMKAEKTGYRNVYNYLLMRYATMNKVSDFCSIADKGYKKFGIDLFTGFFLDMDSPPGRIFFTNCTKQRPSEIIAKHGNEGKLIDGMIKIANKDYHGAYNIFDKLYKEGDTLKISANAGYCLGMMNYYGKGVTKNLDKGRKLLKESFNNGVVMGSTPEQEEFALPEKLELIAMHGVCENIK